MRRSAAAISSAAWFVAAGGTAVLLVPWLINGWRFHRPLPYWTVAQVLGVVVICAGLVPAALTFVQFTRAGGTPFPLAPTQRLVVSGFNRYVRNPIYAGSVLIFIGEALLFGQLSLLVVALAAWAFAAAFVRWYEEPVLLRRFGAEYEAYRRAVPAWLPRLHPWNG